MRLLSEAIAAFTAASTDYTKLLDVIARQISGAIRDTALVMLVTSSGELG